jgi:hypothetical protein
LWVPTSRVLVGGLLFTLVSSFWLDVSVVFLDHSDSCRVLVFQDYGRFSSEKPFSVRRFWSIASGRVCHDSWNGSFVGLCVWRRVS